MRIRLIAPIVFVLTGLFLSACSSTPSRSDGEPNPGPVPSSTSASTTTTHGEGSEPVVTYTGIDGVETDVTDPSRVVLLSGDLTEIVFALGAGDLVVATDITTVFPEEAVLLPKVGIGRFLSPEAVLKHDPTIVIGDTETAPPAAIDQLRSAGVGVVIMDLSTSFEILYQKVRDLGFIVGAEESAALLEAQVMADVSAASVGPDATGLSAAYIYTRGPDVMLLLGADMVTHPVIEAAGARDAAARAGIQGSIPVTPEALIETAPDVLIVPLEGLEALGGIEGLLAIPGIAQTPAGVNGWILAYPEGEFLTIGPRTAPVIGLLAEDLAALVGAQ